MFSRGDIVYIITDPYFSSAVQPKNRRKLWVWQSKQNLSYEDAASNMSYFLKDGPGENAKDVGWEPEDSLREWFPLKEEDSLIDLA